MSCGNNYNTGSCVCDTLLDIVSAQNDSNSLGSCSQSIRELTGGMAANNFNTVPIQLLCNAPNTAFPTIPPATGGLAVGGAGCGTVFVAQGFRRNPSAPETEILYAASSFFRISNVNPDKCCAELEILCETGLPNAPVEQACLTTFTGNEFTRSGIFVTVDLHCFCGITCLPAVNVPAS